MTKKLYAQKAVAIAGLHFAQGAEIKGVEDDEQIAICERLGKVGPKKPGKNKPAPEIDAADPVPDVNEDAELTGEGAADDDALGDAEEASGS